MLKNLFLVKTLVFASSLLFIFSYQLNAQSKYPALKLISIKQLEESYKSRFDLSGIVKTGKKIYVVADKSYNNYMYEIKMNDSNWSIENTIEIGLLDQVDIEAVDYCNDNFYISNEHGNIIYKMDSTCKIRVVKPYYKGKNMDITSWKKNTGLESLAIDCEHSILYAAKERQARFIYAVDLKYNNIITKFSIPETESNDFADMKYENGFIYLLERNGNYITKVDVKTEKVVAKVSFKNICSSKEGKLYEPSKYGMAEALLLTDNEIWIGLDNNGLTVSENAAKKYHMKGNRPAILRFVRPKGF